MTDTFDAVVIGAGHNGLVCAAYLAKRGRRVLIAEAADSVGGASITREFADGYSVSGCAHLLYQFHPEIARDLNLAKHGLVLAGKNLATIALATDGRYRRFSGEVVTGNGLTQHDISEFSAFNGQMTRYAKLLAKVAGRRPPKLVESDWSDKLNLARIGLDIRRLGRDEVRELLRIGAINLFDVLHDRFTDELLKGALSVDGVLGAHMGPRSPNTVLGYLYRHLGDAFGLSGPAIPEGGMGSVTSALAAAARSSGVEIRTGTPVARIICVAGRTSGVMFDSGETIETGLVISNADPKTTFEELVGFPELESGFSRRVHNIRARGTAAKLHLALDGMPEFSGIDAIDSGARLLVAPDLAYVERAFDPAKYGQYSEAPIMEITIPSVHDKTLAPDGKHVLSAVVQYAPYELKAGWDESRTSFQTVIVDTLSQYAPGIRDLITASEVLTPRDIEQQFRIRGGHWHHCELSLDQFMMMRPAFGATQYTTPIDGLYLCGAGAHPGGGVMGLAGRNAANEIIKREKSR
ncbi:MAG: NAD(P)/FAD-dependent oxidoreductase [Gammaproteobacteria bacterium]|nr:NAD(P)/FAD-dependent oxidoreductase [Gammaproteobacteria bacterium]